MTKIIFFVKKIQKYLKCPALYKCSPWWHGTHKQPKNETGRFIFRKGPKASLRERGPRA